jgi:ethanolamine utilization protein EutA (predicted chaperonin)
MNKQTQYKLLLLVTKRSLAVTEQTVALVEDELLLEALAHSTEVAWFEAEARFIVEGRGVGEAIEAEVALVGFVFSAVGAITRRKLIDKPHLTVMQVVILSHQDQGFHRWNLDP